MASNKSEAELEYEEKVKKHRQDQMNTMLRNNPSNIMPIFQNQPPPPQPTQSTEEKRLNLTLGVQADGSVKGELGLKKVFSINDKFQIGA